MRPAASAVPGLERFVLPVGQPPLFDDHGFLLAPTAIWAVADDEVRPLSVAELVSDGSSFALLAAGGAGKSQTFTAMSDRDQGALKIDLAPKRRDDIERALEVAHEACVTVYLDGLDQAAMHDPAALHWLADRLAAPEFRTVSWRLACRSAAWEASLSDVLGRFRDGFAEWKLLPLDRTGARQAVEHYFGPDLNAAGFIDAVGAARLGSLSACVSQLLTTARYWRDNGRLPDGGVEAMLFEVSGLVRETDRTRRPDLSPEAKIRVAKRLGAMMMFAREQVVSVAPAVTGALSADELPDDPEPTEPGVRIDPVTYREVLGTSLFDPGPAATVLFRHQRYPEFLAAAYLVDRRATPDQIADLVGTRATGALPAPMVPVVAWLAALAPHLVRELVADNATALAAASAAVELPDGVARATIVGGLLDAAGRHEARPEWSVPPTALVHGGLEEQLSERLSGESLTAEQMWWVARLAQAGDCRGLVNELADVARDDRWFDYVRRAAVAAVGALGDDEARTSLSQLLHPAGGQDADNEIVSAVIDVLYPRLLSTADLLAALRPHTSTLLGGYGVLLRPLAARVSDQDLLLVLAWFSATERAPDLSRGGYLDVFFEAIIERIWDGAEFATMLGALATELVSMVTRDRLPSNPEYPWQGAAVDRRRSFALAVIESAALNTDLQYVVYELRLLDREDAGWLLDLIETSSPDRAVALAVCLLLVLHQPSADLADRILTLPDDHPAAPATACFRGSVAVDDPRWAREREWRDREHQFAQREAIRLADRRAALQERLLILDDAPERWWEVVDLLADPLSPRGVDDVFGQDLTRRPVWTQLTGEQQRHVLTAGLRYLEVHQPRTTEWWGRTQGVNSSVAAPDWFGVQLVTTLVEHDEELFLGIGTAVWERWAPALIATWTSALETDADLRIRVVDRVAPPARPALLSAALAYLDVLSEQDGSLSPRELYQRLEPEIDTALVERLGAGRYGLDLSRDLLELVVEANPVDRAGEIVHGLCRVADGPVTELAAERLAELDPEAAVDRLRAAVPPSAALSGRLRRLAFHRLDDERTGAAAAMLLDAYPYADDPPSLDDFAAWPGREMRELTGALLRQLADRGCVVQLESLLDGRGELDRMVVGQQLLSARRRRAELEQRPTSPRLLLDLLRRGDARLVRDDADLVDVVVKQLDRLQHDIRRDGAFHELWNEAHGVDPSPKTEDDISDWVRRRLNDRLDDGLVVDREVQVQRLGTRGVGTRIDLLPSAATRAGALARVVVEAKRVDSRELLTAMNEQLIDRYLKAMPHRHGVFLIYWVRPDQRPAGWSRHQAADVGELTSLLEEQAHAARQESGVEVVPYVLDISRS